MRNQRGATAFHFLIVISIVAIALTALFRGCSGNFTAKHFGGTMTYQLPKNYKLVNVTWKESELWVLMTPRAVSETPRSYEFAEKSTLGLLEGRVVFLEQ